jgi:uncharacterized protein (DUF488 family)
MTTFDLFTIGHSNISVERFIALLHGAGIDAIADVRSIPASRFCPWFSGEEPRAALGQSKHRLSVLRR